MDDVQKKALRSAHINWDGLDDRTKAQIERVEHGIKTELQAREEALAEARRHTLDVKSVAAASHVSYATFYNKKDTLLAYLDARREAVKSDGDELAKARQRIRELENRVQQMVDRDGHLVALQVRCDELAQQNDELRERVYRLTAPVEPKPEELPDNVVVFDPNYH